jgi:hyperpolarization activated cyclic nucleotide-gated potassium channel 4
MVSIHENHLWKIGSIPKFSSFSCSWQVIRLQEEFFLPGEVILEQGSAVDQIYFVCHGALVS